MAISFKLSDTCESLLSCPKLPKSHPKFLEEKEKLQNCFGNKEMTGMKIAGKERNRSGDIKEKEKDKK